MATPTSDFCGLHVHSEHSFLDGLSKVEEIAKRAKELGQKAVALTDHGECGGHLLFKKACEKEGVKPLFGMEGYWIRNIAESREKKTGGRDNSHITIIAKNRQGLSDLWAWSSLAYTKEYYYSKPNADLELMKRYNKNLYVSDGCLLTEFARCVIKDDEDGAQRAYLTLLDIFGENFYSELHTFQIVDPVSEEHRVLNQEMTKMNQAKWEFSKRYGVPLVVVNDAHYAWEHQWENHALVWEFSTSSNDDKVERGKAASHMMGDEELVFWMNNHGIPRNVTEEAIKYTHVIAENCEDIEIKPTLEMPRITKSEADDIKLFLDHVEDGFKRKIESSGLDEEAYRARVEEETKLIVDKNFAGYFNIVADYCKAAKTGTYGEWIGQGKQDGLLVGHGRGSAGGSLTAFLMDITEIDPLKYDLMFERFLTPGRKGYPDIDLDFPQSKQADMKEYLMARHGHDHTCAIGTRSYSGPRGVLADLVRAMKIPYEDGQKISKIIGGVNDIDTANIEISWDEVLQEAGGDLASWATKYPLLFKKMGEMVGLCRTAGKHAAGMVVSATPLLGNIPTRVNQQTGLTTTQFDMYETEDLGGIKDDILGLRHLDTLAAARKMIHERHGVWLDYYAFGDKEFSDPAIWEQIDREDTFGVFQLMTPAMTPLCREFKCRSERDVADLISVNRPGVVRAGMLWPFIYRRQGKEPSVFDHPLMEELVGSTYGIIVYQEQVLRTVQRLAGFTVDESDYVRKILGKMLYAEMVKLKDKFVEGCLANPDFMKPEGGYHWPLTPKQTAEKIWASIQEAGVYSFNKSHGQEYSLITSCEVWVRHYYFHEFMAACLQTDEENKKDYAKKCKHRGIDILLPDINISGAEFTLDSEDNIRYGLEVLSNVGASATKAILSARPYASLEDYIERCPSGGTKKGVLEVLVKVGAFDSLDPDRAKLLKKVYDWRNVKDLSEKRKKTLIGEYGSLDNYLVHFYKEFYAKERDEKWKDDYFIPDFSKQEVVWELERTLAGDYISGNPMEQYHSVISELCIGDPEEIANARKDEYLVIGGQISKLKLHTTKNKKDMAFISIDWNDQNFEVTVFPESYKRYRNMLAYGAPVIIRAQKLDQGCHMMELERLDWIK